MNRKDQELAKRKILTIVLVAILVKRNGRQESVSCVGVLIPEIVRELTIIIRGKLMEKERGNVRNGDENEKIGPIKNSAHNIHYDTQNSLYENANISGTRVGRLGVQP